jgi:actin-related protein
MSKKTAAPPPPKKTKEPPVEELQPPEDSIPLRAVVAAMAVVCVATSCFFVKTNPWLILLYVWGAISGSFVSYQYRNEKNLWIHYTVIAGVLAVLANFAHELVQGFDQGKLDVLAPIVHQVAGTFALHTFELKTRSDINMSSALGLALICLTAPAGQGLIFGMCVLVYVVLGAIMLYYDCVSRTVQSWLSNPPIAKASILAQQAPKRRRNRGSIALTIAFLPILSLGCFVFMPRGTEIVSEIAALVKAFFEDPFAEKDIQDPRMLDDSKDKHEKYRPPRNSLMFAPADERKPEQPQLPLTKKEDLKKKETKKPQDKKEELRKKKEEELRKKKEEEERKRREEELRKKKEEEERKRQEEERRKREEERRKRDEERLKREQERLKKEEERKKQEQQKPQDPQLKKKMDDERKQEDAQKKQDEAARKKDEADRKKDEEQRKKDEQVRKQKEPDKQEKEKKQEVSAADVQKTMGLMEHIKDPDQLLFKVVTNRTIYLRRFSFDKCDGQKWTDSKEGVTEFTKPVKGPYEIQTAPALALPKGFSALPLDQNFSVETDIGNIIPAGWVPQKIEYDGPKMTVDTYGNVRGSDPVKKGAKYKITSQLPVYTLPSMRKTPLLPAAEETKIRDDNKNYLQLPENHSEEVTAMAQRIAGEGNWFVQAENICKYLRKNYSYQLNVVKADDNAINEFLLKSRIGDCEDFASSFTIMCRCVGIPARSVGGYAPGDLDQMTGTHLIRAKHAHAWGEAYIPGSGWVPFDSTPDGYMPAMAKENSYDFDSLQRKIMNQPDNQTDPGKLHITAFGIFATGFGLIIVLILAFFVIRTIKALLDKFRKYRDSLNPSTKLFLKVQNDLKLALKVSRQPQDTPTDYEKRVKQAIDERMKMGQPVSTNLPTTLSKFLDVYSSCYFGNKRLYRDLEQLSNDVHELVKPGSKR